MSMMTGKRTRVWMQRTQHSFSYPGFFHLAIKLEKGEKLETGIRGVKGQSQLLTSRLRNLA